ncbi:hypothetical protein, partial [Nocardia wallacei]|uniref:hypothetical protein n=1 Tax=Nocardia wallacei TaxID=480035 RepID=UPI002456722A
MTSAADKPTMAAAAKPLAVLRLRGAATADSSFRRAFGGNLSLDPAQTRAGMTGRPKASIIASHL